jgi:hypothetical protein
MTGAPKTIHECAAANMSAAEAASAMGVSLGAAYQRAHRAGVALRDTRAERMRKRNADPDHNPLVMLTTQERADYDALKRNGYSRADAFRAIGRGDMITQEAAE